MSTVIKDFIEGFSAKKKTRVLAFGSSNTERYLPDLHWFDCFELALRQKYGRIHTCINTGVSGNTSRDLLERFENDAAFYKPQLVFITIGGNDCNPEKNLDILEFRKNLQELHRRFTAMNCGVIFQTYYSPDPDDCEAERLKQFYAYTDVVRKIAAETNSELVDHLVRWERLRIKYNDIYKNLMRDGFHVKPNGNKVIGVDIARRFGIDFSKSELDGWEEALTVQKVMDELENTANE
jgi:lysophospholipase L1-like esterase